MDWDDAAGAVAAPASLLNYQEWVLRADHPDILATRHHPAHGRRETWTGRFAPWSRCGPTRSGCSAWTNPTPSTPGSSSPIVAALGGNALLQRGEHPDATVREAHIHQAAATLAELALAGHELIITHGNGPRIGLLALESAADPALAAPYPLDVLGAQTQCMIGTLLVREPRNKLPDRTVVAQTVKMLKRQMFGRAGLDLLAR